jgi:hypothetical protein
MFTINYLCVLFIGDGVKRRSRSIIRQQVERERNMEGSREESTYLVTMITLRAEFSTRVTLVFSLLHIF